MTLDQFISQWNGKGVDVDGYYGFQCFDLAHRYAIDCVGIDIPAAPAAKDLWGKTIAGYDKISNSPTAVPSKGDIIIWGTGLGPFGHVAVFIDGDAMSFNSFDQNFPLGSVCHIQKHNYTGVLGWFHPKKVVAETIQVLKSDFERLVSNSTKYDAMVQAGYIAPDQIKALLATSELAKNNAETHVATLENALKGADMEIGELKSQIAGTLIKDSLTTPKHTVVKFLGLTLWIINE